MEWLFRTRPTAFLALVAASGTLPAAMLHFAVPAGEAPMTRTSHLLILVAGMAVATAAALALIVVGARNDDGRAVAVGGAFGTTGLLLAVHGLSTPGVLIGDNGLVTASAGAALPLGAGLLALAAHPSVSRPQNLPRVVFGYVALLVLVLVAAAVALLAPGAIPDLPEAGSPAAVAAVVLGVVLLGTVALRSVQTFALTRRGADLAIVVGAVWLGIALAGILLTEPWSWAWWISHVFEVGGVLLLGVPTALDLYRGRSSNPLTVGVHAVSLVDDAEAFLGPRVRVLLQKLIEKDRSTEEHTRRVSVLAVRVGEELGLSPGRLRDLALGGILHDMGKLRVPTAVLCKPGPLDDDEFEVIKGHPAWGEQLLAELGFSARVRRMVHDHHERLDGNGYPRGLTADRLELETRILAVCDVFDALVSDRVYRPAWPIHRALSLLRDEAGTVLDANCVAALEKIVRERDHAAPLARAA